MKYNILILILIISNYSFSQKNKQENSNSGDGKIITGISFDFGFQIPGGDMAKRFGNNYNIGGTFWFKTKNNFILGLQAYYLFSNNLKKEAYSILDNLKDQNGNIVDQYGNYSPVLLSERGYFFGIKTGKIFILERKNITSGILTTISGGFLEHHILIENELNNIPQIMGDYTKGYDKLVNGFALQEFIGYMFIGKRLLTNFIVGFEFTQAFTQSRRSYDFNLKQYDNTKRIDLLYGIRISWLIPFYKKEASGFYIY
jgi:hypothetical protein